MRAWILARSAHVPFIWHAILGVLLAGVFRLALNFLGIHFDTTTPEAEGFLDFTILFFAILISLSSRHVHGRPLPSRDTRHGGRRAPAEPSTAQGGYILFRQIRVESLMV